MTDLALIETALGDLLEDLPACPAVLREAVGWALLGGGKRLRPLLCLAAAEAAGGTREAALAGACAIECLHAYTLVHDDLPAMDGDVLRRGRASVWKKFGEANAILAGDALQALAFRSVARLPRNAAAASAALAEAAFQVVAGQVADVAAACDGIPPASDRDARIDFIFANKTAALFVAAAKMGALAAEAPARLLGALTAYARHLGYAFQYADDLLDAAPAGAAGRKDFSAVVLLGEAAARARLMAHTAAAEEALADMGGEAQILRDFARTLARRTR